DCPLGRATCPHCGPVADSAPDRSCHHCPASSSVHCLTVSTSAKTVSRLRTSGKRSSGFLARHLRMMASNVTGTSIRHVVNGAGDSYKWAATTLTPEPVNGGRPVNRKYANAPTL